MKYGIATTLFLAICSASLAAQATLSVSPGPTLQAGSNASIGYCNPNRAGETVTVTIVDGTYPVPRVARVKIQLDKSGEGTGTWKVEHWGFLAFNAPEAIEVVRITTP